MTELSDKIDALHLRDLTALGNTFVHAAPFPHIVLDQFFTAEYAHALLATFPSFEQGNAVGDDGQLGHKSTIARIRKLGEPYAALDDMIQTPAFLAWLGRVTKMDGLLYDPFYLGGGTHDNRHGASLNAHIDFNYHPSERWHRRLNLIVYLNPEWDAAWGGSLELFRDPHANGSPDVSIEPRFNRCVIFETSERSWHGFSTIQQPAEKQSQTRKSIALYFYSKTRPESEVAPKHTTIYVQRPLPEYVQAGHTLTEAQANELRALMDARDAHIRWQYDENTQLLQAQERGLAGHFIYLAKRAFIRMRGR
jgi:2OG-Fe(II) oxygenase superfamily